MVCENGFEQYLLFFEDVVYLEGGLLFMLNELIKVNSINRRIVTICLLISLVASFFIFYIEDNLLLQKEACADEVNEYVFKNRYQFLSDEYFTNIDLLFKKIKKEYGQWDFFESSKKIVAKAVINQMMDDLESNPNALKNNKNFMRFYELFDSNIRQLGTITERMHYFRNILNSYSGAPDQLKDMIDLAYRGEWHLFSAKYHRYDYGEIAGALNVKFISSDGRFEAVYNTGTGRIVTDPANMGTYNYAPGSLNPIAFYLHSKYDKEPWKKWGNTHELSYKDIMKLKSGAGTDEAIKSEKEVEDAIKRRQS